MLMSGTWISQRVSHSRVFLASLLKGSDSSSRAPLTAVALSSGVDGPRFWRANAGVRSTGRDRSKPAVLNPSSIRNSVDLAQPARPVPSRGAESKTLRKIGNRPNGRLKSFIKFNKVDKSLGVEKSGLCSLWEVGTVRCRRALAIVESVLEDAAVLIAGV